MSRVTSTHLKVVCLSYFCLGCAMYTCNPSVCVSASFPHSRPGETFVCFSECPKFVDMSDISISLSRGIDKIPRSASVFHYEWCLATDHINMQAIDSKTRVLQHRERDVIRCMSPNRVTTTI